MAKTNIIFNNKNYSIDESSLSTASSALRTHLSSVMNGTGAAINFGGTAYGIDSAKLTTATNDFVSHLRTIAGNGHKVVVNGVEYGVDSVKVAGAMSELHTAFSNLASGGGSTPEEERLEGDGQEFYTTAPSTLSFRSTAPLSELQDVQINGVTVDPSNYTLEEGSTIVKLSHEYLSTLDVGSYELSVVSDSKTVKGGFNVTSPELNEYGFYYNVPYSYSAEFGSLSLTYIAGAVVFLDNGTVMNLSPSEEITYSQLLKSGTDYSFSMSFYDGDVTVTGNFSADGKTFVGANTRVEAGLMPFDADGFDFFIDVEAAGADEDWFYIANEERTSYSIMPICHKASYKASKVTVNDKPVVAIGSRAFSEQTNLESIEINKTITRFDWNAFYGCTELKNIIFTGTISQWNAVDKGGCGENEPWNRDIPATYVQCSDGQVAL